MGNLKVFYLIVFTLFVFNGCGSESVKVMSSGNGILVCVPTDSEDMLYLNGWTVRKYVYKGPDMAFSVQLGYRDYDGENEKIIMESAGGFGGGSSVITDGTEVFIWYPDLIEGGRLVFAWGGAKSFNEIAGFEIENEHGYTTSFPRDNIEMSGKGEIALGAQVIQGKASYGLPVRKEQLRSFKAPYAREWFIVFNEK